jgi:hypothetical protein
MVIPPPLLAVATMLVGTPGVHVGVAVAVAAGDTRPAEFVTIILMVYAFPLISPENTA